MNDNTKIQVQVTGLPTWVNRELMQKILTKTVTTWLAKNKPPARPPSDTDKPSMRKLFK